MLTFNCCTSQLYVTAGLSRSDRDIVAIRGARQWVCGQLRITILLSFLLKLSLSAFMCAGSCSPYTPAVPWLQTCCELSTPRHLLALIEPMRLPSKCFPSAWTCACFDTLSEMSCSQVVRFGCGHAATTSHQAPPGLRALYP